MHIQEDAPIHQRVAAYTPRAKCIYPIVTASRRVSPRLPTCVPLGTRSINTILNQRNLLVSIYPVVLYVPYKQTSIYVVRVPIYTRMHIEMDCIRCRYVHECFSWRMCLLSSGSYHPERANETRDARARARYARSRVLRTTRIHFSDEVK